MELGWQQQQRAFQARVVTQSDEGLGLRPYRTFVGSARPEMDRRAGRIERLIVILMAGAVIVAIVASLGAPREIAALIASFVGGVALMTSITPATPAARNRGWTPLLAIYSSSVMRGDRSLCVTEISVDELDRLGMEGFGTVVGKALPGASFGLFVDDYLVWPRTPPRGPETADPLFGAD